MRTMVTKRITIPSDTPEEIKWLSTTTTVNGKKWIVGNGKSPAKLMIVGDKPTDEDCRNEICMGGKTRQFLIAMANHCEIYLNDAYLTYAVKFKVKGKTATAKEIKLGSTFLHEEIKRVNPSLIVCLGKTALEAVLRVKRNISDFRGVLLPYDTDITANRTIIATYSPSHVMNSPVAISEAERDWLLISEVLTKGTVTFDKTEPIVINKYDDLSAIVDHIITTPNDVTVAIDAEWQGKHWMDPNGYMRTFQFTMLKGMGIVIEFYDETGKLIIDNMEKTMELLSKLLTAPNVKIVGHNVISDGEWLLSYGIDIRDNVIYDTMLAEHTLNPYGPFGLEAVTVKYTNLGRYDVDLLNWKLANPDLVTGGYGKIPRDILIPYAAADVDTVLRIMEKQLPDMQQFMVARGKYPSLWQAVLCAQKTLYEIQVTGMRVDQKRLAELTKTYNDKLLAIETRILDETNKLGIENFNFNSPKQVSNILFNVLKLTPVETTSGKPWEWVLNQTDEIADEAAPATDKKVLDILQDEHVFVKLMRDARKIEHSCKTWLIPDSEFDPEEHNEVSKGGGLRSKIWPDGKVHARFSQLKETSRFGSSKPNCQNFPKKAEEDVKRIFGKEHVPPSIKSVFVPAPGHVFIESDWKQAELFVLAYLSGDENMIDVLITPGRDLHDLTTNKSFNIKVTWPDGRVCEEAELIDIAKTKGEAAFKKAQKTLLYTDTRGKVMDRDSYKSSIRVSGKNIGFGIPYGRGAEAIALQVKSETGSQKSISELQVEIQKGIDTWKNELYPKAWAYMVRCGQAVANPGYLVNPWGRIRHFPPTDDKKLLASMGRQGQNWPKNIGPVKRGEFRENHHYLLTTNIVSKTM